jgi:hypothetical protein
VGGTIASEGEDLPEAAKASRVARSVRAGPGDASGGGSPWGRRPRKATSRSLALASGDTATGAPSCGWRGRLGDQQRADRQEVACQGGRDRPVLLTGPGDVPAVHREFDRSGPGHDAGRQGTVDDGDQLVVAAGAGPGSKGGWSRHLGVCQRIQYRRAAMRVNRQQLGTRVLLVLAVVLVSLWTGSLTAPSAGTPADYLTTSRSQPGLQPAALRDSAPALRPAAERPGPRGRLVLLTILAAVVAGVYRWRAAAQRRGLGRAGSRAWSTPLAARAPPHLQPA